MSRLGSRVRCDPAALVFEQAGLGQIHLRSRMHMAGLGAAFNLINAGALIGLAIWQNIKAEKEYNKAGDRLDANLKPLTDNTTSDNLKLYPEAGDPWGGDSMRERLYQMHLDNMYKHDITPFDWAAVREANRKRYEAAA